MLPLFIKELNFKIFYNYFISIFLIASTIMHVHTTIIPHNIDIAVTTSPISPGPAPIAYPTFVDKISTNKYVIKPIIIKSMYFILNNPSHIHKFSQII